MQAQLYGAQYVTRRQAALRWYHAWMAKERADLVRRHAGLRCGDRVLEIGCDSGLLLRALEQGGAVVEGIDINADAVAACEHASVRVGSAQALPYADASFDCCIASHVVEHLPDHARLFTEAARVLSPGGRLVLWYPFELFRGMTVLPELIAHRQPLALARRYHLHRFRPSELRELARHVGLVEEHWRWCVFGPVPEFMTVYRRVG